MTDLLKSTNCHMDARGPPPARVLRTRCPRAGVGGSLAPLGPTHQHLRCLDALLDGGCRLQRIRVSAQLITPIESETLAGMSVSPMALAMLFLYIGAGACTSVGATHQDAEAIKAKVDRLRAEYHWPTGEEAIGGSVPDQDCVVAQLAYEFSLQLQPDKAPLREVFDALELGDKCGKAAPAAVKRTPPSFPLSPGALFVDAKHGSDSAKGTEASPLKTVGAALKLCEGRADKAVVLRAGVHFLSETLIIGPSLSGLTIQNYPAEEAWLSGGVPLTASWSAHAGEGIYVTPTTLASVPGLNRLSFEDPLHARMTRARYPNKVPSTTMEHGLAQSRGTEWHKPPGWGAPGFNVSHSVTVVPPNGTENFTGTGDIFTYGVGGWSCGRYTPAGGFWCSNQSSGGGSGWELMVPGAPLFPVALELDSSVWGGKAGVLTQAGVPDPTKWKSKSGAVIETWTNGWSTTFWEVTDIQGEPGGNSTFVFGGAGGQQTGRGFHIDPPSDGPNHGPINTEGGWKIENAMELLDADEEFFFDPATKMLYLKPNTTSATASNGEAAPPSAGWVVPQLKQLVRVVGSSLGPQSGAPGAGTGAVTGVKLLGVGFRDSAYTYMDEWGIPSGGDWALHRGGALFVEDAVGVVVDKCEFTLLDGNALFLSGRTRNVTISNSSFSYIGDNAMAAWGYTDALTASSPRDRLPEGTGIDGRAGRQPRYTRVLSNIVREIGLNERQSSACTSNTPATLLCCLLRGRLLNSFLLCVCQGRKPKHA